MIRKIIPFFLLLCTLIFTLVSETYFYTLIHPYIGYTNGWSLFISIGYYLMARSNKEGIFCELSSLFLVLTSLFTLIINLVYSNPDENLSKQILFFDVCFTASLVGIVLALLFFKKYKYKLF